MPVYEVTVTIARSQKFTVTAFDLADAYEHVACDISTDDFDLSDADIVIKDARLAEDDSDW